MEAKDMLTMPDPEFRAHVVEYLVAHDAAIAENTRLTRKVEATADQVAEDTAFIRNILGDVAAGARLMCRLAAAWRFFLKQMFLPIGMPFLALYGVWYYSEYRRFPEWLAGSFKFLMAVL
ncbi:hypothetical protein PQQ51_15130 [Paraburkholderia xenovorans]|uniref:hypothetical protein n=1 Tax=Paraburkholderia xenovorans TaxID=36873 RepID=UPI0038BB35D2